MENPDKMKKNKTAKKFNSERKTAREKIQSEHAS